MATAWQRCTGIDRSLMINAEFSVQVSGIHELLNSLVEMEKDILSAELTSSDIVSMISNINTIIQASNPTT